MEIIYTVLKFLYEAKVIGKHFCYIRKFIAYVKKYFFENLFLDKKHLPIKNLFTAFKQKISRMFFLQVIIEFFDQLFCFVKFTSSYSII